MSKALTTSRWRIFRFLIVLAVFACHSDAITSNALNIRVLLVNLASSQLRVGQRTQATVTVMDSTGATVRGVRITWASSNTSVASINDTTAIVTALSAGSTTISASTEGVTGSVGMVVLDAPPPVATKLAITTQPAASATSGQPLAQQPVVQLQDANSTAVSQSGVIVSVAMASGNGTLSGTATATTNANGTATFSNLAITGSGAQTLQFTAPSLTGVTSGAINVSVTPPVATKLAITTPPAASATSGQALAPQPVIQLQDANSNAVSQSGVVVSVAMASGNGMLGGTATATTNANGTATFSNLAITGSGAQTLQFTAPSLTGVTSGAINVSVTPPVATKLAITTPPAASATSGQALAPQPVIQLQDANSNAVSQSGVVVSVAMASGNGTLGGTATATTNANGTATFSNLAITGSGAQTLQFTAPSLTGVTSGAINVSVPPPVATKLAITTPPAASATSGQPLAQQPVVQLQDANSTAVSQSGVVVTVAIATGGGTLSGTTTATTNANGTATFTNLAITGSGAQTLLFAAPNLTAATSNAITVTVPPPVATKLAITTQPAASATSGQALAPQPVIQLQDANSSAVSQSGVVVTAAIASGGGTLSGTATATTNASGVATFTNLTITGSGAQTLVFTAPNLTAATSNAITVSVPPPVATKLAITTQPAASVTSGQVLARQPVIQLQDANSSAVSQSGVVVTAAIASGGGTLSGTATATTNASGVATFTNLTITGSGAQTLVFTAPNLTSVTSSTITVSVPPPVATKLAITTQPAASATSGQVLARQPVIQLQDANSSAVSQSGVVVTAAIASGGGTLSGTATATTNASGVATFTNLIITGSGAQTLVFTAPNLTSVTSAAITVTLPPVATKLAITTQPAATASSGSPLGQQPVLQLQDVNSSPVSQSGVVVTAAIASGGGTLSGTTTATTNANGTATFSTLAITGSGAQTLVFTAPNLTSATSATITVSTSTFQTPNILNNASFETDWNGFTDWSQTPPPTGVSRSNALAYSGSWSVVRTWVPNPGGDATAHMMSTLGGYDRVWVRFYFRATANITTIMKFCRFYDSPSFNTPLGGFFMGSGNLIFSAGTDAENQSITTWFGLSEAQVLDGNWHSLEIDYWRNGDPSGYPSMAFWFDGNSVSMPDGNNVKYAGAGNNSYWSGGRLYSAQRSSTAKLGAIEWVGTLNGGNTTTGQVNLDMISISTLGRIGP